MQHPESMATASPALRSQVVTGKRSGSASTSGTGSSSEDPPIVVVDDENSIGA